MSKTILAVIFIASIIYCIWAMLDNGKDKEKQ